MKGFFTACHFLTRLSFNIDASKSEFNASVPYFPLVGLLLGALLLVIAQGTSYVLQPLSTAVVIIVAEIILTGGLHLDGLIDSCDALFSGRGREEKLAIMKDCHIGAMGVLGLAVLLLLKLVFLLELPAEDYLQILLVMPMVGRWAMIFTMYRYPYARKEGLGALFRPQGKRGLLWSSLYCTVVFCLTVPYVLYITLPLTVLITYGLCERVNTLLQGHTGDTYGLVCETTEVTFLFCCVLVSKLFQQLI